jgi:hypothetical protein
LKQCAERHPVADICRKAGISHPPYLSWKKIFEGLLPDEMRLKQLEVENNKLKGDCSGPELGQGHVVGCPKAKHGGKTTYRIYRELTLQENRCLTRHGRCILSTTSWRSPGDENIDGSRHLLKVLAGDRFSVQLLW